MAHVPWGVVARDTLAPHISFSRDYVSGALALLGTTLTSYVFVWHTVELAEERPALSWLRPKEADAAIGMFFAVAIFWFILIATGATLGRHHHEVQTADDAARALRPLAGSAASYVFGFGLLGSALLALPVLMGTIAYVVGAEFDWRRSLSEPVRNAPRFYAVMAVALAIGIIIAMIDVSPIQLLFFASIVAGIGTPVTLVYLLLIAGDRRTMRDRPVSGWLRTVGWAITIVMTLLSVAYLAQQLLDQ
jgi:Mn2+/Fe2+ NRAMP family transporter